MDIENITNNLCKSCFDKLNSKIIDFIFRLAANFNIADKLFSVSEYNESLILPKIDDIEIIYQNMINYDMNNSLKITETLTLFIEMFNASYSNCPCIYTCWDIFFALMMVRVYNVFVPSLDNTVFGDNNYNPLHNEKNMIHPNLLTAIIFYMIHTLKNILVHYDEQNALKYICYEIILYKQSSIDLSSMLEYCVSNLELNDAIHSDLISLANSQKIQNYINIVEK